jgi:phage gp45-like
MSDEAAIARLSSAIRSAVTRAQVVQSGVSARCIVLVDGLANERFVVELLLPFGMSARPTPGADVLVLQPLGSRDHAVAIGGDAVGGAIADLAQGEFGFSMGGVQIAWRLDRIEISTTAEKPIVLNADGPVTVESATGSISLTASKGSVTVAARDGIALNTPGAVTVNGHTVTTD